jgi:hypothetical protein
MHKERERVERIHRAIERETHTQKGREREEKGEREREERERRKRERKEKKKRKKRPHPQPQPHPQPHPHTHTQKIEIDSKDLFPFSTHRHRRAYTMSPEFGPIALSDSDVYLLLGAVIVALLIVLPQVSRVQSRVSPSPYLYSLLFQPRPLSFSLAHFCTPPRTTPHTHTHTNFTCPS